MLCTAKPSHRLLTGSFQSSQLDFLVTPFHLQKPLQPSFPNTMKAHPSLLTESFSIPGSQNIIRISCSSLFQFFLCVCACPVICECAHMPIFVLCIWYVHMFICTCTLLSMSAFGVNISSISLHLIFRDSVSQ